VATTRYCAFDDKEVRELRKGDPAAKHVLEKFGKGEVPHGYFHVGGGSTCGRQFVTEDQTYVEGDATDPS
jgi:hypothetical protein